MGVHMADSQARVQVTSGAFSKTRAQEMGESDELYL